MAYMLRTQEWGAMNRGLLRAENLAWAVRALPGHKNVKIWEMQRRPWATTTGAIGKSRTPRSITASGSIPFSAMPTPWEQMDELFKTPEMYYYGQYYLESLICPAGMVPDFGDAHWEANWPHFLVFFEAAAASYKNPNLKWAATTIARKFIDFKNPTSVGLGYMLLDCVRWGIGRASRPFQPQTPVRGKSWRTSRAKRSSSATAGDPGSPTSFSITGTKATAGSISGTTCETLSRSKKKK